MQESVDHAVTTVCAPPDSKDSLCEQLGEFGLHHNSNNPDLRHFNLQDTSQTWPQYQLVSTGLLSPSHTYIMQQFPSGSVINWETFEPFNYLGIIIDNKLSLEQNTNKLCKGSQNRLSLYEGWSNFRLTGLWWHWFTELLLKKAHAAFFFYLFFWISQS